MKGYKYKGKVYTEKQIKYIAACEKEGLDTSIIADPRFIGDQMKILYIGLKKGVDISAYSYVRYTAHQMEIVLKGLLEGYAMGEYTKPEHLEKQTLNIYKMLKSKKVPMHKPNLNKATPKPDLSDYISMDKRIKQREKNMKAKAEYLKNGRPELKPPTVFSCPNPDGTHTVVTIEHPREVIKTSKMKIE